MRRAFRRRYKTISTLVLYAVVIGVALAYRGLGYSSFPEFLDDVVFLLTDPTFIVFVVLCVGIFIWILRKTVFRAETPRPAPPRKSSPPQR